VNFVKGWMKKKTPNHPKKRRLRRMRSRSTTAVTKYICRGILVIGLI
jgi:hypothetical protein